MNKKFSPEFLRLLESINKIREHIIWLPLYADDTEESFIAEIKSYLSDYENNTRSYLPTLTK